MASSAGDARMVASVSGMAQLQALQDRSAAEGKALAVFCWASFHAESASGGRLDVLFSELAKAHGDTIFARVDAEEIEDVADALEVEEVPHFVFFSGKRVVGRLTSSDGKAIAAALADSRRQAASAAPSAPSSSSSSSSAAAPAASLAGNPGLRARIRDLTQSAHAVLFMKGTPANPRCKFSRAAVGSLDATGAPYGSFDILSDPDVRACLKEFGGRQTYPQLWVGGSLLGGGDEIASLAASGGLASAIAPKKVDATAAPENAAHAKCRGIATSSEVMLFMKGEPDAPRCGFSARIVEILRAQGIDFASFDVLSDPEVRQGLKECLGKWPTFPQLFVKGEFAGGLDVVKEMVEEEDEPLKEQLGLA